MKQSILFGNGINRINNDNYDWEKVLKGISPENLKDSIDNRQLTHSYERLLIDAYYEGIFLSTAERELKESFIHKINEINTTPESEDIYQSLINLGAENYMTTNYDGKIEEFLSNNGYHSKNPKSSSDYLSLHRREVWKYRNTSKVCTLWPIHGCGYEGTKWNTVMLGFEHYCNSISCLGHYLNFGSTRQNGYYGSKYGDYLNQTGKLSYIQYLIKNYRGEGCTFWADLFFLTDVHIIGFGMDFSEIDIWWLLTKRARLMRAMSKNFKGKDLIRNKIFYYGHNEEDKHKIELLEAYGVKCIIKDKPEGENWKGLYDHLINEMKINMDTRKNH